MWYEASIILVSHGTVDILSRKKKIEHVQAESVEYQKKQWNKLCVWKVNSYTLRNYEKTGHMQTNLHTELSQQ